MNKLLLTFTVVSFCCLLASIQCSEIRDDATELSSLKERLSRFRRFSFPSFPNEKRSDFDDPRFFSSAYGKRSGGQEFHFNPEFADFQL